MKQLWNLLIACLLTGASSANPIQSNVYQYSLDLLNVQDDKVQVELITPKINKNKAVFYLPKIIPGTYTVNDFGRFITDFQAFDIQGNLLPVEHPEVNTWKIGKAKNLYRIRYKVDDSYDATGGKAVAGMSGTNIEAGKNFLLNGHGFFGYFGGMKSLPFEVSIKKPEGFAHQSAYENVQSKAGQDLYKADDYNHVVDMPVMYCKPDTAVIRLGNTEVLIAVYSPNGVITSALLREKYETLLHSQSSYLGGKLPVNRYAFLMYFMGEALPIGTGALEHNYSSVYCMPEMPFEQMSQFLVDIASHEFFHIITPLNVHSKEIHYFDFNKPELSRHLWMYEGVTEYFSHHNQVRSGMITPEQFLRRMGQKIQNSQSIYDDELAFTELSQGCLGKHENQYANVYEKGALIAMCLDISLLQLSAGKYGIVDMMADLSKKYGSKKPFKDKQLFKSITAMTYPEIGQFLKKYVAGSTPIPYHLYFEKAGIEFTPPKDTMVFTLGGVQLGFNQETQRLIVANTYYMNEMGQALGYKVGDEFLKIDGMAVPTGGIQTFIGEALGKMEVGKNLQVTVARKNESGAVQEVLLQAVNKKVKRVLPPGIQMLENPSAGQVALQNVWLGLRS